MTKLLFPAHPGVWDRKPIQLKYIVLSLIFD